ncbi:hypothetical protein [Corynebacterium tapiri]|uniref:YbjN domain-containing protein n=1 Tax=Corynebacterium tapiri TaxID=1448266 RepID=A0A5C4U243_9CORY|nr:hypothetical protein [Corynebacterium tapiri]TNL95741.1 hypothetical protein FHE74_09110 [Corynebacterium tapiri]
MAEVRDLSLELIAAAMQAEGLEYTLTGDYAEADFASGPLLASVEGEVLYLRMPLVEQVTEEHALAWNLRGMWPRIVQGETQSLAELSVYAPYGLSVDQVQVQLRCLSASTEIFLRTLQRG